MNPDSLALINLKFVPIPILTSTPETGVRFGGALEYFFNAKEKGKNTEARGSYVHGQITYSTKSQLDLSSSWQIFGRGERYVFRGNAGFQRFNERYWGVGNNTVNNDDFNGQFYNRLYFESRTYKLLTNQNYVGLAVNFSDTYNLTYSKSLNNSDLQVAGINGSKVFGLGPAFLHEGRDFPFSAHKGSYLEVYYQYHFPVLGDQYNYGEWMLDWRKFIPVSNLNTLAFQFMNRTTIGDVPLREMPRLGSSNLMRGFFTGRFRDKSFTAAQSEFRFHIWRWLYGSAFGAVGIVGESISSYESNNTRYAGGAGLRFLVNKKNRMFVRLDYARNSTGGSAFYIKLNEAF
ncbi:MAG: hypothetical protein WCP74_13770 [Sphingobacteriia bacterium]